MSGLFALIPVLLFLAILFLLDSFKLIKASILLFSFVSGCTCAIVAWSLNIMLQHFIDTDTYSKWVSPVIEEILKAAIIFRLLKKRKAGFLIDAGIYGFAVGAGFSVIENIYYLFTLQNITLVTSAIRGLGTAIMHSGTISLLAIFSIGALNLEKKLWTGFFPGLLLAIAIHSWFNHFYIHPVTQTILIAVSIPMLLILIFKYNEQKLSNWLETGFFNDAELLGQINKGEFTLSKSGKYLASLKDHFSPETIVDMYCFIRIYLELSVKSKRNMLLAECELPIIKEPDWKDKVIELKNLKKTIGRSGELALSPLIKVKQRDLCLFEANE
jgi:protease PrsW